MRLLIFSITLKKLSYVWNDNSKFAAKYSTRFPTDATLRKNGKNVQPYKYKIKYA